VHGPIVGHATTVIIAVARGICNGNVGRRQAIREAWHLYKGSYETPFQQFIEERFLIGIRMFDTARALTQASISSDLSEYEQRREICRRFYPSLVERVFPL